MSDPKGDPKGVTLEDLERRIARLEQQNRERGYLSEADEKAQAEAAEGGDDKATAGNKPRRRRLPG